MGMTRQETHPSLGPSHYPKEKAWLKKPAQVTATVPDAGGDLQEQTEIFYGRHLPSHRHPRVQVCKQCGVTVGYARMRNRRVAPGPLGDPLGAWELFPIAFTTHDSPKMRPPAPRKQAPGAPAWLRINCSTTEGRRVSTARPSRGLNPMTLALTFWPTVKACVWEGFGSSNGHGKLVQQGVLPPCAGTMPAPTQACRSLGIPQQHQAKAAQTNVLQANPPNPISLPSPGSSPCPPTCC